MITLLGCAASDDGHVYNCSLLMHTGVLSSAYEERPCLADPDVDGYRQMWVDDLCTMGQECSATCEPTTTTCEP
jgi:hypothetical protein